MTSGLLGTEVTVLGYSASKMVAGARYSGKLVGFSNSATTVERMNPSDEELIRQYRDQGNQDAFASLVERHLDLVYSAARRQVRSPHLAQDVAQIVFIELARQAGRLPPGTVLPAWLYTVTRRRAVDAIRRESKQRVREHVAAEIAAMNVEPSAWTRVEPVLDDAMEALSDPDRAAVLLRFFEQKNLRDVGRALGTTEDAAQKRVSRALDRLKSHLVKRGVTTTAATLAAQISANAVQSAPTGLAVTVNSATAAAGAALASTSAPVFQTVAMTTIQKTLISAGVALGLAGGVYQAHVIREQQQRIDELERTAQSVIEERDLARDTMASMRTEMQATDATLAEMEGLLGVLAEMEVGAESLTSAELKSWAARRRQLKEWASLLPELTIPEMQHLTETDWLQASREAELDTEEGARKALSSLRGLAKHRVIPKMQKALKDYLAANNDSLPTDVNQLLPFLESAMDPAILERYEVVAAARNEGSINRGQWQMVEKETALVDDRFETRFSFGKSGWGNQTWNRALRVVNQAVNAYRSAHDGQTPATASQLASFLPDRDDVAVQREVEAWMKRQRDDNASQQ